MIRRAIFGKAHSQFPAKHTNMGSGARIVFARPKVTAHRLSEANQLLFDPLESELMSGHVM